MKDIFIKLLEVVNEGVNILTAQEIHKDIPTIHNITGKYHSSVVHMGWGYFEGATEKGKFTFCGGGAMNRIGDSFAYTSLDGSKEVLADLGYDIDKVKKALVELIERK
jgi:hypothetical protein